MPDDEARDDDDARAHLDARRETSSDANMAGASTRDGMGLRAWDGAMGGEDANGTVVGDARVDARRNE